MFKYTNILTSIMLILLVLSLKSSIIINLDLKYIILNRITIYSTKLNTYKITTIINNFLEI